jgi:chemosensory pili system protein ChpA (sensor histidine kinase/response regulator)
MRLGEMAHRLESAIEQIDVETVTVDHVEPLLASFDNLEANFQTLSAHAGQDPSAGVEGEAVPGFVEPVAATESVSSQGGSSAGPSRTSVCLLRRNWTRCVLRPTSRCVRAQLLDRLVNQAGEVMISRSRLDVRLGQFRRLSGDLSGNLDRLRQQLRDIEVQAESQMQSRMALAKDSAAGFDPLNLTVSRACKN